ncbi:MetQ/NlpA family ABC transporter substrate-binding protein [Corynebacterium caspium]|uniref:MetQ/NlpA family ABC transporter substrate-binding protein n=1 Tax=Corynebacterium caspium TaxID=234828 RepID=UPI00037D723F|nr:MetQ/NlpA family ABC transporter substrate-binding protein [Corynebacterium caspium]WKD59773.1 D-methionine-binding lipoprotein MetQ precursor [Corynebacterium caspium DSM 44850]
MKLRKLLASGAAVLIATTGLVACSGDSKDGANDVIKIGTTDSAKKAWITFAEVAKEEGFDIEIVDYSDYNTPNDALNQGQIDVNQFQHLKFLANYNHGRNTDLTPIVSTEVVPLALFWKGHTSIDGIEGQSIAIPNDSTNQGRAINVLVQAGLLTLKSKDLIEPTPADIDAAKSKVQVTPVDAAQSTVVYGEGKPAVINNSFLDRAGINPKSAVFSDDPANPAVEPYINAFVVKKDRANDQDIIRLGQLWHSDKVQAAVNEDSAGTSVQVQRAPEELQAILARLQENLKNAK